MKTCITCSNPCQYYFDTISPKCNTLFGQEATQLRQHVAEMCSNYMKSKPQFDTYSNGEPYTA